MASLNRIVLSGTVIDEPDIRATSQGTSLAKFSLAVERVARQDTGFQPAVDQIKIIGWRDIADQIQTQLSKGDQVELEGAIRINTYETDGERRYATEVEVQRFNKVKAVALSGESLSFSVAAPASKKKVESPDVKASSLTTPPSTLEESDFRFDQSADSIKFPPPFGDVALDEDVPF